MKRRDLLNAIAHAEDEFGALVTGGAIERRDVVRAINAGLVRYVGIVQVCDGDGFQTGREAPGYRLTEEGRRAL